MNSTLSKIPNFTPSEYTNIGLGCLLLFSELLPMIKKHKGNGIIDTFICMLKGSSCCIKKLTETLEEVKTKAEVEMKVGVENKV